MPQRFDELCRIFPSESEGKQCRSAVSQSHSVRDVFTTLEQKGFTTRVEKSEKLTQEHTLNKVNERSVNQSATLQNVVVAYLFLNLLLLLPAALEVLIHEKTYFGGFLFVSFFCVSMTPRSFHFASE